MNVHAGYNCVTNDCIANTILILWIDTKQLKKQMWHLIENVFTLMQIA